MRPRGRAPLQEAPRNETIDWLERHIPTGHLFEMLIYSEEFNLAHSSCPALAHVPPYPFRHPRAPSRASHADLIFWSRSAVRFVALWTREYIKSGFCVCWRLHTRMSVCASPTRSTAEEEEPPVECCVPTFIVSLVYGAHFNKIYLKMYSKGSYQNYISSFFHMKFSNSSRTFNF